MMLMVQQYTVWQWLVVTSDNGSKEETAVPMEICGVYGNPIKNLSSIHEEIYTAAGLPCQISPHSV